MPILSWVKDEVLAHHLHHLLLRKSFRSNSVGHVARSRRRRDHQTLRYIVEAVSRVLTLSVNRTP